MNWFHKVRLRVLAVVLAGTLAVIGILAWATVPAWPVVGVAIITVAAVVNSMTTRLAMPVCYQCGSALNTDATGCYGVICAGCGAVNEVVPSAGKEAPRLASSEHRDDDGRSASSGSTSA